MMKVELWSFPGFESKRILRHYPSLVTWPRGEALRRCPESNQRAMMGCRGRVGRGWTYSMQMMRGYFRKQDPTALHERSIQDKCGFKINYT